MSADKFIADRAYRLATNAWHDLYTTREALADLDGASDAALESLRRVEKHLWEAMMVAMEEATHLAEAEAEAA